MRMRIAEIRFAVCRPSSVRDTHRAGQVLVLRSIFKVGYFSLRFIDIELSFAIDESHTGTIIPAIFQAVQPLNEYRVRLPFTYISYYSAHSCLNFRDILFNLIGSQKYGNISKPTNDTIIFLDCEQFDLSLPAKRKQTHYVYDLVLCLYFLTSFP